MSDDPRREPTTTEFAAVPDWAIELTRSVKDGFAKVDANVGLVISDLEVVKGRVGNLEEARRNDETRAQATSIKVRGMSETDMEHESKLAEVIVWRAGIDTKLTGLETTLASNTAMTAKIESAVTDVLSSPRVKALSWALWVALAGWLASKGISVK